MGDARRIAIALVIFALAPSVLYSDALVIVRAMTATTIAEIFIEPDAVTVEIEIGVADLMGFRDLMPDEIYERLGFDPEPFARRVPRFFREGLTIRPDGGNAIVGRVEEITPRRRIQRDEITGEPLPLTNGEGEPVVFARLVYPLASQPDELLIKVPTDEQGQATANIGFVAYHRGLPVNDFRYLAGEPKLTLDWEDPWYSQFDSRNLRRQFSAPVSAFLYIEPYEVRKEIVARPKDLQQWVDLGLEGKEVITVAEQEELKRKVAEFLADRNPVTIDGRPAEGELDRVHFIYRSLRTSGVIDPPRDLDVASATLGIIFYYPTEGLPDEVTMEWELFGERFQTVPTSATDEAGGLPYFVSVDDPVLRWQNFLTDPSIPGLVEVEAPPAPWTLWFAIGGVLGTLGLVVLAVRHGMVVIRGDRPPITATAAAVLLTFMVVVGVQQTFWASRISHDSAEAVVGGLLENIYRAFDFRDEGIIYDSLEHSVAGDLLTDIYLETRRSLELENQGGARAKVKKVEILESHHEPLDEGSGFVSQCTWNVTGSVGHWGHIHQRVNQYEARFTVEEIDGAWRITSLELLQEERLTQPPSAPAPRSRSGATSSR